MIYFKKGKKKKEQKTKCICTVVYILSLSTHVCVNSVSSIFFYCYIEIFPNL